MGEVVIVGAGIIGLSCAYFLYADGHSVVVLDRDPAGRDPGTVADDPVDRVLVHARNSFRIVTHASGSSQKNR